MPTIFYSVMGEGRGHAARARAMVERLRDNHRVVLYSSFDALEFLRSEYADDAEVDVRETPGLKFHYTAGKLDLSRTIREGLSLWWNLKGIAARIAEQIDQDGADLVVTDFEPTVARAAHRRGVPVMSLDHQHFLVAYDLSSAPARLQRWAWAMGWSVWMFGLRPQS
ncbi:MAG: glycosyltransferase family protein, partial [Planctomycetota bacterium]